MRSPQRSLGSGAQLHADTLTVSRSCTKDKFGVFFSLWKGQGLQPLQVVLFLPAPFLLSGSG